MLTLLDFPTVAYDVDHDLSSSASFEYFAARHFQFGKDILQNVGPLGWVHYSQVYAGYLHEQRLVLKAAMRLVLAALALWTCTRLPTRAARIGWLLAFALLLPIGGGPDGDLLETNEVWAYVGDYLVLLVLLAGMGRPVRWPRVGPALLYLAVRALMKHTLLLLSTFGVCVVALARLRRGGGRRDALLLPATYAGFVALLWLLSGQSVANLPEYALGAVRFSSGYNEAMGLAAPPLPTGLGLASLAGLGALVLLRGAARAQTAAKSLIDLAFLFVVWKHAFVRADPAHLVIFFQSGVFFAFLFGLASEEPRPRVEREGPAPLLAWRSLPVWSLVVLCTVGLFSSIPDADYRPARLTGLWRRNLAWIAAPGRQTSELEAALRKNEELYALPWVRERVGRASIDLFGYEPGWLLLNQLNYVPRPMPITFAAANPLLLRRNEAFYRDPQRAPQFVLCKLGAIDGRLAPQDDGLALGALLDDYHPVLSSGELLLLERNPPGSLRREGSRRLLRDAAIGLDEPLPLADLPDRWLWLEANVRPTLAGRLRALLLRPAPVRIALEVEGGGPLEVRRYVPSMGTTGFLISPLVERSADLFDAYASTTTDVALASVRSVRFEVDPGDRRYVEPRIAARAYAGPRPRGRTTAERAPSTGR